MDADRARRAADRATWPGRKSVEDDGSPPTPTTAQARIEAVWTITLAARELAGQSSPVLPREKWPGRVVRGES